MYPYLAFLLLFFALPCVPLAWICRKELARHRKTALWSLFFVCTIGAAWDWLSWKTATAWFSLALPPPATADKTSSRGTTWYATAISGPKENSASLLPFF